MKSFLSHINPFKSRFVYGCYIHIINDTDVEISAVKIDLNSRPEIVESKRFTSFASLKPFLKPSGPVLIGIDGKGVIHKSEQSDGNKTLRQLYPNIDLDDFFTQHEVIKDVTFYSIARKTLIEKIIADLKNQSIYIAQLLLGGIHVFNLMIEDRFDDNLVVTDNYTYKLPANSQPEIFRSEVSGTAHDYNNQTIQSEFLVALAIASYYKNLDINKKTDTLNKKLLSEYKFGALTKLVAYAALAFFFVLLLVNYLIFDSLYTRKKIIERDVQLNREMILKLDSLQTVYNNRAELLERHGLNNQTWFSGYIDDIAISVPGNLYLDQLSINPATKLNSQTAITFEYNTLMISGFTSNSRTLYNWIDELGDFEWVTNIGIDHYSRDETENTGSFKLNIDYHAFQ